MNETDNHSDARDERERRARQTFSGLVPSAVTASGDVPLAFRSTRVGKGMMATVPIVLAGAMTVSIGLTVPLGSDTAIHKRPAKARVQSSTATLAPVSALQAPTSQAPTGSAQSSSAVLSSGIITTAAVTPNSYTVKSGDTVSSIAGRYGLSTASVLAANGLSWKSLIFPGQVLTLAKPSTRVITSTPAAAPAPAPAASPTPAAGSTTRYTIVRGDTISAIASRFGVSTKAVLSANGLSPTTIIYPGQTISIPSSAAPLAIQTVASVTPVTTTSTPSQTPSGLSNEMAANARIIIQVGQRLGVPDRGIVIALAAAMQESGLRNLRSGDRDSVGIFQQRPSTGWGTASQLLNVGYAAQLFYGGPQNPNTGRTRGLLDIPGWQSMSLTQAAQAVQISAYPTAYAQWEVSANAWFSQLR